MGHGARCLTAVTGGRSPADHAGWLALARQQWERGERAAAAASFGRAAELAPPGVNVWNVAAAAHLAAAQYAQALDAAERAILLEPARAAAHANRGIALSQLGHHDDAIVALQRAVELRPDSGELIEHLALALHRGDRRAQAAPWVAQLAGMFVGGATARPLPLVGLLLEQADLDGAARVIESALARTGLTPEARSALGITAGLLTMHRRLEPTICAAAPGLDVVALAAGLAADAPDPCAADETLLARLERIARRAMQVTVDVRPDDAREPVDPLLWPAVAAHFNSNGGDDIAAVRRSLLRLQSAGATAPAGASPDADFADMHAEAQLRRELQALRRCPASGMEWEAWLRLLHFRLNAHRPERLPGHLKVAPNSLRINPREPRTEPQLTAGTLRRFYSDVFPVATTGWARAAMHVYVTAKVHPFVDGNGALGRLLASAALEEAGLGPVVLPGRLREPSFEAIRRIHRQDDPEPLMRVLVEAWRSRDAILGALN